MSRKSKIDAVKKVEIVEQYLNGELSQKGAAKMCGVNKRSVQDWIRIYKTDGPESLLSPKTNKRYSESDSILNFQVGSRRIMKVRN